jgi:hypothetical protein
LTEEALVLVGQFAKIEVPLKQLTISRAIPRAIANRFLVIGHRQEPEKPAPQRCGFGQIKLVGNRLENGIIEPPPWGETAAIRENEEP